MEHGMLLKHISKSFWNKRKPIELSLEQLTSIKDKKDRFIFCQFCGIPLSKQQIAWRCKYCTHYCSEQAQRKYERIDSCLECGKTLTKKQIRRHNKFCSKKCSGKHVAENYPRTYGYDTDFLDKDTPFKARFIGFYVAEGSMPKSGYNKKYISLSNTNKQLIDQIKQYTNYKNKITPIKRENCKIIYALTFYGRPVEALEEMGFVPGPKSCIIFIPDCINDYNFKFFLGGEFDGDGWFTIDENGYLTAGIASNSEEFLIDIHKRLKRLGVVKGGGVYPHSSDKRENINYIVHFSHADAVKFGNFIYEGHNLPVGDEKKAIWLKGKQKEVKEYWIDHPPKCIKEGCEEPYFANGLCVKHYDQTPKRQEQNRLWVKNNPEKVKASQKRYYDTHTEQRIENSRTWKENNSEKDKARQKEYYEEHKEQRISNSQKWIKEHPEQYKGTVRKWAKKNRKKLNADAKEWRRKNPERSKAINKKSRDKNRDKINAKTRKDRKKNPEKYREYERRKRMKDPEKIKQKDRERYLRRKQKKLQAQKINSQNQN